MASPLRIRELDTRLKVGIIVDAALRFEKCEPGDSATRFFVNTDFFINNGALLASFMIPNSPRISKYVPPSSYTRMWSEISDFYNLNGWNKLSDASLSDLLNSLRESGGTVLKQIFIERLDFELIDLPITASQIAEAEQRWID